MTDQLCWCWHPHVNWPYRSRWVEPLPLLLLLLLLSLFPSLLTIVGVERSIKVWRHVAHQVCVCVRRLWQTYVSTSPLIASAAHLLCYYCCCVVYRQTNWLVASRRRDCHCHAWSFDWFAELSSNQFTSRHCTCFLFVSFFLCCNVIYFEIFDH